MSDASVFRDPQTDVPGAPGTPEGEARASESDPAVPSVERRDLPEEAAEKRQQ